LTAEFSPSKRDDARPGGQSFGCEEFLHNHQGRAERAVRLAARVVLNALTRTGIGCESEAGPGLRARDAPAGNLAVTGPAAPP